MCLYTPLLCAKFQSNRIWRSRFIAVFVSVRQEEENKKKKKTKKLSQFFKTHILGTREAISLKFGMWNTEVGGSVHSKNRLVSSRWHSATEVRRLCFCFFLSIYSRVLRAALASWAARHTTVCLDTRPSFGKFMITPETVRIFETSMVPLISTFSKIFLHFKVSMVYSMGRNVAYKAVFQN